MYPDQIFIPRDSRKPQSSDILYFISTTTNQNVFKDLQIDIDTNLKILTEVLSHCKKTGTIFNFVSSGFVYGNDVIDAKEDDPCDPTGFYSITKRCAESLVISYCKTFGIEYRIFRIGNVYGLDPTITSGKNVLGYMISLLKHDKQIKLYDGGDYLKDYMFVDDICRAIDHLMVWSKPNEIYNIASGSSQSFRSIITTARDILDSKSELIDVSMPDDQKYIQVKNMTLNTEKLQSLKFDCEMSFYQGLQTLCDVIE
jgi:nucleoside-diphosphate-sugar epimerase